jgi:hypothetical protein
VIEATRVDSAAPLRHDGSIQPSGSFRLTNLLPGSYLVSAASLPSRSGPQDPQWGATRIDVSSADVDGVVLQLKRSVSVKGLVTFEDPPASPLRLKVQTRWNAGSRPAPSPAAVVADDGTFELEGLFGPVVVSVLAESAGPYVVSAVRHRGRDVTDTALEFDGTPGESLEILLTNRTATLAGVVRDSAGPVVASAVVICFPIDSQRWAPFAPCRAKVSSDGSWKLPPLVAGEYHVVALSAEDAASLLLPADYEAIARVAQRVRMQPREGRTLELRMTSLGR